MVCFVMDSRLPPGIPRHLHALVGPSVAFVFLVSLISFLVHHWCPDAKGKSQEERPVHLGKVGKGGDSVQVCAQGRSHRHRAVFLSSLPSFLPFFLPSLFGCIGSSLQHRGTWLHHTESFVLALGLSSLVHKLNCSKACRILVPGPGIKPASPALRGRFLTTGLPGKSQDRAFKREHQCPCPFSQLTGHCILLHWSSAANNI